MRIAVWQARSTPAEIAVNRARLDAAAGEAAAAGADLLITPEMFLTGYNIGDRIAELARESPFAGLGAIAARHRIGIIAGGPELAAHGCYNTAVCVSDRGETLGSYHKTHLFGDLDRRHFVAGSVPCVTFVYRGIRIAMLICYDVEFPEAVRAAALQGAELIAVPTAQMHPYSIVNRHVIPTRAWENQAYVAYANQHGADGELDYVGLSTIAAPDGAVLAVAGEDGEALVYAEVDASAVARGRAENPYLHDLRQGLFTL